jgi:chemotaxis protein methyltransferase CheR
VLGTDVNGGSLGRARRGVYRSWSLRGMPAGVRGLYLRTHPDGVEVAPQIRAMVRFARLNLAGDGYPSAATGTDAMDLILCRNVLLYFGEAEAGTVVGRLRRALAEDGWLLLSQVEARFGVVDGLQRPDGEPAAFRRAPDPATAAEAHPAQARSVAGSALPYPYPILAASAPQAAEAREVVIAAGAPARAWVGAAGPVDESGGAVACGQAVRLWREGEHRRALVVLAAEAARAPLLPGAHYLCGLILLDRGRTVAALAAFRRCTYADPGFVLGYVGQAGVLVRAGERRRAGAALDTASGLLASLDPGGSVPDGTPPDGAVTGGAVPGGAVSVGGVRVAEVWGLLAAQRRLLELGAGAGHD